MTRNEPLDERKNRHDDDDEQALRRNEGWFAGQKDAFQAAMDGEPLANSLAILIRTALERGQ